MSEQHLSEDIRDAIQEIANIAVGLAADKVARVFSTFVEIPIPRVHLIESADIVMALSAIESGERITAVTQSFYGIGVSGEALLLFTDASMHELSKLMKHEIDDGDHGQAELVLEIASLLNGSCIQGIFSQLAIDVLLKHPTMLAQHKSLSDITEGRKFPWSHTLAIEINYSFEGYQITCDLVVLLHENSLPVLIRQVNLLLE